jgi:SnoaL-like domain
MSTSTDQHLQDRLALHDLVMAYCRSIDRRDYKLLRSLYHDDAIEDLGGADRGNIDERLAYVKETQAKFEITTHRMFNTMFVIDGDKAEGEHYIEAYHRTPGRNAQEIIAGGRVLDRYEKRNGVWKFAYRARVIDRTEMRPTDGAAYEQLIFKGNIVGRTDASDASYKALTRFPRSAP